MLRLTIEGTRPGRLDFEVRKMINAGYASRDQAGVRQHIEELKKKGIPAPESTPTFYPVLTDRITTAESIEVLREETSGEAEYVLLYSEKETFVAVGSDHTDRKLEEKSIVDAKQLCPNVISSKVWRYSEVQDYWDELVLRAWAEKGGQRRLYQEATLAAILSPDELARMVRERLEGDFTGLVLFSGTVPTVGGEVIYSPRFEAELFDPRRKRSLSCSYSVHRLSWFKGEIK